ncbi:MAG: pyridoxine 5'-phosphate synthase [Sandaracinaceae bacterium]|nr:pyridoxine 5'-phosphate synthase [Sandaracinaceae bacterium]
MQRPVRLHVNVDHVATLRQVRGTPYPDPVEAALACEAAGAHGITVHLREDRRHIQPEDVERLRQRVRTLLNLEMAPTEAMTEFALRVRPNIVTFVPERREERTTEGGLDADGLFDMLKPLIQRLKEGGIEVSLFIEAEPKQIDAALRLGVSRIEFHTGHYANAKGEEAEKALHTLHQAAEYNAKLKQPLHLAAGHGLTVANVPPLLRAVPSIRELNIGHAIVSDALFWGIAYAVRRFLRAMEAL